LSNAVSIDTSGSAAAVRVIAAPVPAGRARTRWWVEAGVIVWLCWVYDGITNLAPLRLHVALGNAVGLLRFERSLHVDPERALDHWLAGHHTLGLILSDYYDNAHFIVTLGLLGWLWWGRADLYRPLRDSLVLVNALAFAVFWLYPVAPPRMLGGFTDVVASTHAFGSWHTGALASHANQLAAMPSLHMAWAAWCALALWRVSSRGWVRGLALAYPCMTALAVLATGNHFLLDILGGLVAMALAVFLTAASMRIAARLRELCGSREGGARAWLSRAEDARGRGPRRSSSAKSDLSAYRVSQTCYEVQDQVD
jgi:membrane-associated phospholipid phosphatase